MFDDFDDLKTKNPEVLRETKHMFCWVNVMSFFGIFVFLVLFFVCCFDIFFRRLLQEGCVFLVFFLEGGFV